MQNAAWEQISCLPPTTANQLAADLTALVAQRTMRVSSPPISHFVCQAAVVGQFPEILSVELIGSRYEC